MYNVIEGKRVGRNYVFPWASRHAGTELIIYSVTSKIPYKDLGSGEFIDSLLV